MCKTIKCEFDKRLTFEKLLYAHNRASKGKKLKDEIIIFMYFCQELFHFFFYANQCI